MFRAFCAGLLWNIILLYYQKASGKEITFNKNPYPRPRRSHEPGHGSDDEIKEIPGHDQALPNEASTLPEEDHTYYTSQPEEPHSEENGGQDNEENNNENPDLKHNDDFNDGPVIDRPQRETGRQQPPTGPENEQPRLPPQKPQNNDFPPPPGRQHPRLPQNSGRQQPPAAISPDRSDGRDPPRRQPQRPPSRPDRQPQFPPVGPPARNSRPDRIPQPSGPINENPAVPENPASGGRMDGPGNRNNPAQRPRPKDRNNLPQRPRPNNPPEPGRQLPQKPDPRHPTLPERPGDRSNPYPPEGLPQPGQRERPEPPIIKDPNPIDKNPTPNEPQIPRKSDGEPSEPTGEQKRSPQRQNGPVDTRNTVCESVCTCQRNTAKCVDANMRSVPKPFPRGLESISIKETSLEKISSSDFAGQEFSSITTLVLTTNKIKKIEGRAFTGMTNLREFTLRGNSLTKLSDDTFLGLSNLQTLSLADNKLKNLNEKAFGRMMNIRTLGLNGNQLESIPSELFDIMTSLEKLSLSGNPWDCDCKLLGLFVWLQSPNVELMEPVAKCAKPKAQEGKRLNTFSTKEMQEICIEDDDEEEEKTVEEKIEEKCSEHNSSNNVNICYISESVYSQPGKKVCIHCAATVDEDELTQPDDMIIEWKIPYVTDGDNSTIQNETLCIEKIQASDSGEYVCMAKSGNNTDERSVKITVNDLPHKVAIGLAVFIAASIVVAIILLVKWWSAELRALKT